MVFGARKRATLPRSYSASSFPVTGQPIAAPCPRDRAPNLRVERTPPGMNELESLTPTGQYGVQAKWKDGHDTGIYSWEYLRLICPCPVCSAVRTEVEKDSPLKRS